MSDIPLFWPIAAAMSVLAAVFALPWSARRRGRPPAASGAAINAAICRAELADLDRERAEGVLTDPEHTLARDDLQRRLLADVGPDAGATPRAAAPEFSPRAVAIGAAAALPVLAFGLYALVGDPAALAGVRTEAPFAATDGRGLPADREGLVRHLGRHPADGRAWVLLARADFDADRFADAAQAYAKALAASPKIAADPGVWCEYADALGMAQGGTLTGRPRELVERALALDPAHPKALEMAGSAAYEQGDYASALQHWRRLMSRLDEGSQPRRELAAAIARVEGLAPVLGKGEVAR